MGTGTSTNGPRSAKPGDPVGASGSATRSRRVELRRLRDRRVSGPAALGSREELKGESLVLDLVSTEGARMLSVARRYSYCEADAHDAWQRALEILIRRAPTLEPTSAPAWLRTVVKHEALAVRADRRRSVGDVEYEPEVHAGGVDPVSGREGLERIEAAAEALQGLKPQESEAFLLLASGMTYREIAEAKGWTYTKVNRLLTEGRRSFRERLAGIESGAECERWSETLSRIVDGEASGDEVEAARPHLRRCAGCRASLRSDREMNRALAFALPGLLAPVQLPSLGFLGRPGRWIADAALAIGIRLQGATELVASSKAAVVVASAAALAGSGAAVRQAAAEAERRPAVPVIATRSQRPSDDGLGTPVNGAGQAAADGRSTAVGNGVKTSVADRGAVPVDAAESEFDPISAAADGSVQGGGAERPGSGESIAAARPGGDQGASAPPKRQTTRSVRTVRKEAGNEFGP